MQPGWPQQGGCAAPCGGVQSPRCAAAAGTERGLWQGLLCSGSGPRVVRLCSAHCTDGRLQAPPPGAQQGCAARCAASRSNVRLQPTVREASVRVTGAAAAWQLETCGKHTAPAGQGQGGHRCSQALPRPCVGPQTSGAATFRCIARRGCPRSTQHAAVAVWCMGLTE